MTSWENDPRVPCTCATSGEVALFRAELWVSEHWLASRCPRHHPLDKYTQQIEEALRKLDEEKSDD